MQGSSMVMSEVIASLHEYTRPSGLDGLHVTGIPPKFRTSTAAGYAALLSIDSNSLGDR